MNTNNKKIFLANAILIGTIVLVSLILILLTNLNKHNSLKAEIYYENNLIKTIDLSSINKRITEDIYLKDDLFITIQYQKNAIRVLFATCHTKECVKTNWTSNPNKPIICLDLHYKIILKQKNHEVDVVI